MKLPTAQQQLIAALVARRTQLVGMHVAETNRLGIAHASQRKSIREIIELGPGSIVKFDKTCDEPLDLCIGDRLVAQGEVVKVGDKFGLKISGLVK